MGTLDDILAADSRIFTNANMSFEVEAVTLHAKTGLTTYTANAQVFRETIEVKQNNTRQRKLSVFVARSAVYDTLGDLAAVEIQRGWAVDIADDRGGSVTKHMVKDVEHGDAGGWTLTL